MRLFIAILFGEELKSSLYSEIGRLKGFARSGSFTERENLHLTVNFIGETKRLEEVKAAMQKAVHKENIGSFIITVRGFGKFSRRDGNIYWIGVEKEPILLRLQKELVKELKEEGFYDIDDHEYRPHLTLGRRVVVGKEFNDREFEALIHPERMQVSKISLMKSERVQGKLTYTEIYHVDLK